MNGQHEPGVQLEKRAPAPPEVFEAELVDERQEPPTLIGRLVPPRAIVVATQLGSASPVAAAGRVLRATPRRALRASWTSTQGGAHWVTRAAGAATHRHLREQLRLARLAGDAKGLGEWSDRLEKAKDARLQRVLAMPRAGLAAAGVVLAITAAAWLLVLLGGVIASLAPGGLDWAGWWSAVGGALSTASVLAKVLGSVALVAAVPLLVVLAWREGRRVANPPMWLLTPDERAQEGAEITADTITQALAHMKIQALTKYIKEGGRLEFIVPPREQGGGTYFQVRLPLGVTAAELLPSVKVELLAGNLTRHKHETWPQRQPDADARVLDCWVADKGTMDRPAPPWPLLLDGTFNVFRERLPWGATMRGEPIQVGMMEKHWLIGANSKQGKTTVVRTLLLGVALDWSVELRIADLKGDGDFRMLRERCHTYIEGQADEHAEAAVVMLEDVVAEMQRRYTEKERRDITGPITEQLAREKGSGFHPMFVVVDECQVMYMAGKATDGSLLGGSKDDARAQKAAKRLHDQARAVLIHLIQATQRPDPQTIPVRVREGPHVRVSLYVPNVNAAKMILADAAERGARPHDLRPGADAGTVVAAGEVEDIPAGQAFAIVRTHYVSTEQAVAVAQRATDNWRRRGRHLAPVTPAVDAAEPNHLAAIEVALRGEGRVRTTVVLARLIEDDPDLYESWDLVRLSDVLTAAGAPTLKTGGLMHVVAGRVLRVIGEDR
ncbi:MAG: hypothetical protein L0I24_08130 [Pseudonocardia sp.]|nr:hypothetical protein [Pseudonocardia sp.]MDN5931014.1 hypothetical protein [Pseudonocardia sp.]